MSRKRITWDTSVGDRELLVERVKEAYGASNDSEALETALKAALDYHDLIEHEREKLRNHAQQLNGEHFAVSIRTRHEPK